MKVGGEEDHGVRNDRDQGQEERVGETNFFADNAGQDENRDESATPGIMGAKAPNAAANMLEEIKQEEEEEEDEFEDDFFVFPAKKIESEEFQAELHRLYSVYCPEKANKEALEEISSTYNGREKELLCAVGEQYKVTLQLDGVTLSTRLVGKKENVFKRRYGASAKKVTSAKVASLVSHASSKLFAGLERRSGDSDSLAGPGSDNNNNKKKRPKRKKWSVNTSLKAQEGDVGLESLIEKAFGMADLQDVEESVVIQPLIDPETVAYELWNWLEIIEAVIGVGLGWLIFIQLANIDYIRGEDTIPPSGEIGLAVVSFMCSNADLIFNILSKFWVTHGRIKYLKYFLNCTSFFGCTAITLAIYYTAYNNDACIG